jgi:hypothetical protein
MAVAIELVRLFRTPLQEPWVAAVRTIPLRDDVAVLLEMWMIGPDPGVEHGPAYAYAIGAVAEVGRPGLDGVCRCADQRSFPGVAPDADEFEVIEE